MSFGNDDEERAYAINFRLAEAEHVRHEIELTTRPLGPTSVRTHGHARATQSQVGPWTRRGLTFESFKFSDSHNVDPHAKKAIKMRHLHMIAAGGCVGAGMFVGSGSALAYGGPAALVIGFSVVSLMIVLVCQALGELAVMYPNASSLHVYATRYIHPSVGFAMGWNYALLWLVAVPLEITVCAITAMYWPFNVSMSAYIAIFLGVLTTIAVFGAAGYGEEEFWSAGLKIVMMVVFMGVAVWCITGGGPPEGKYNVDYGTKLWRDPGAFSHGFKGVCASFTLAAFALNGTELIGLAVMETKNPAKAMPRAIKQITYRCIVFYILGLLLIGFLVPWNDPRLLSTAAGVSAAIASPFVIVAADAGIRGMDSFFNVVILVSVISVGASGIYGAGRTLVGLAEDGMAPRSLKQRDIAGRPTWALLITLAFSTIAFMSLTSSGVEVFEWLVGLTGVGALFNWAAICLAHINFRRELKSKGKSVKDLKYKAPFGIDGSILALCIIAAALAAQFYVAVSPVIVEPSATAFFKAYLGVPVILTFGGLNYAWRRYSDSQFEWPDLEPQADVPGEEETHDDPAELQPWQRIVAFFRLS